MFGIFLDFRPANRAIAQTGQALDTWVVIKALRIKTNKNPANPSLPQFIILTSFITIAIAPFGFGILPWLESCAAEQQVSVPVPVTAICLQLIAVPISMYGISRTMLKNQNKKVEQIK